MQGRSIIAVLIAALTGCVSVSDRQYAENLAAEARLASHIQCVESCEEMWVAAQRWARYSANVKRVDIEPRQINVMTQDGRCRVNMTIDLKGDAIEVRAKSLPYGFMYSKTCGRGAADHAILDLRRVITRPQPASEHTSLR